MNIDNLKKDANIKSIVDSIMNNTTFTDKCEKSFKEIYSDGKLDQNDIPMIINLLMTIYVNTNNINIKNEHLKNVLLLMVISLLEKYNKDTTLDSNLLLQLIEPHIDLLLLNINVSKCKWCSSRPNIEDNDIVNNIKLKKRIKDVNKHSEEL